LPNQKTWIEADAYLFDIDGTLLNAYGGAHYHAFHSALEHILQLKCKIDGVPLHGNTDTGILRAVLRREGVSDDMLDRNHQAFVDHMCAEVERNKAAIRSEACASIPEVIRALYSRGKLLGVASGNFEQIGWLKIEAAGLREFFSFGSFSDHNELRRDIFKAGIAEAKRRLGPQASVCVVGDTPADVTAAKDNKIPVIAVATGIYSLEQLEEHGPDIAVTCLTEFVPHLQRSA
jgi:phosphoglycolate phosphatase-like HAD superfamily hydrolase